MITQIERTEGMGKKYKKYEAARILLDVSRVVSSSLDLDKVSELVLKESINALGADHASLFLIDENARHLVLAKAKGFSEDEIDNIVEDFFNLEE